MPNYNYEVQTPAGQVLTGSLNANDQAAAQMTLEALQLRITSLTPDVSGKPRKSRPISAADFQAFNLQLTHLTSAGIPLETGLRMMASEMGNSSVAVAANEIANDLERGVPIVQAFALRQSSFPLLYGKLLNAGVTAANLPGVLLSLSRHLEIIGTLRSTLWRTLFYPYLLFIVFTLVIAFVCREVVPAFRDIFNDFRTNLPELTQFVLGVGPPMATVCIVLACVLVAVPVITFLASLVNPSVSLLPLVSWVPLIRPVFKFTQLARWTDSLLAGVVAGVPLPQAISIASDSAGGSRIAADSQSLIETLNAGRRFDHTARFKMLPPSLVAAIQLGIDQNDLPRVLANMTEMYLQHARQRVTIIPVLLMPIFMVTMAILLGIVILAMFLPLVKLISTVSGP